MPPTSFPPLPTAPPGAPPTPKGWSPVATYTLSGWQKTATLGNISVAKGGYMSIFMCEPKQGYTYDVFCDPAATVSVTLGPTTTVVKCATCVTLIQNTGSTASSPRVSLTAGAFAKIAVQLSATPATPASSSWFAKNRTLLMYVGAGVGGLLLVIGIGAALFMCRQRPPKPPAGAAYTVLGARIKASRMHL